MIDEKKLIEDIEYYISHTSEQSDEHYAYKKCKELVERQPKVGEWIPVSERLPDKGRTVLLQTEGNQMAVAFLNKKSEWYVDSGDYYCTDLSAKPIAWMPLPEPFRE